MSFFINFFFIKSIDNLLISPTLDAAEAYQFLFQCPATMIMDNIIDLHHDIFSFMLVMATIVFYLLIVIIYKFKTGNTLTKRNFNFTHHTNLEIVWTLVPMLVLLLILIPSFVLLYSIDELHDSHITFKIFGRQWFWTDEFILDSIQNEGNSDVIICSRVSFFLFFYLLVLTPLFLMAFSLYLYCMLLLRKILILGRRKTRNLLRYFCRGWYFFKYLLFNAYRYVYLRKEWKIWNGTACRSRFRASLKNFRNFFDKKFSEIFLEVWKSFCNFITNKDFVISQYFAFIFGGGFAGYFFWEYFGLLGYFVFNPYYWLRFFFLVLAFFFLLFQSFLQL